MHRLKPIFMSMGGSQAHVNSKAKNPGRGDARWNRGAIVSPHFAANLPFSEAILSGWHSLNAVESAGSRYDSAGSYPVGDPTANFGYSFPQNLEEFGVIRVQTLRFSESTSNQGGRIV